MPKLRVEILMPSGDSVKIKRKTEGNKVLIEKSARGKQAWQPEFDRDCIVNERVGLFKRKTRPKVVVKYGADKCISFPKESYPAPDRNTIQRLFDAQVLQNAGKSVLKVNVPISVYLLLAGIFILALIQFLSSRSILR